MGGEGGPQSPESSNGRPLAKLGAVEDRPSAQVVGGIEYAAAGALHPEGDEPAVAGRDSKGCIGTTLNATRGAVDRPGFSPGGENAQFWVSQLREGTGLRGHGTDAPHE